MSINYTKKNKAQLINLIECLKKSNSDKHKNYTAKIESATRSLAQERDSTTMLLKDNATLRYTLTEAQKIIIMLQENLAFEKTIVTEQRSIITEANKIIAMLQENLAFEKTIVTEQRSIIMAYREKSEKDCLEKIKFEIYAHRSLKNNRNATR